MPAGLAPVDQPLLTIVYGGYDPVQRHHYPSYRPIIVPVRTEVPTTTDGGGQHRIRGRRFSRFRQTCRYGR